MFRIRRGSITTLSDESEGRLRLKIPVLRAGLWVLIVIVLVLTVLPSLYLVLWAFGGTETVGLLSPDFSLKWFRRILYSPEWQLSIAYSAILGIVVSGAGCLMLTLHFYFMRYVSLRFDQAAYVSILMVVLVPTISYALALRILGGSLHIHETLLLLIGHVVLVLPIQFFVLESKQEGVATNLLFAGSTLGASHVRNIGVVYLPLMIDALLSAFIVGFFLSFDELVIATFIIDSRLATVPKRLWDEVNRSMDPAPAVISCLVAGAYLSTLFATVLVRRIWRIGKLRKR